LLPGVVVLHQLAGLNVTVNPLLPTQPLLRLLVLLCLTFVVNLFVVGITAEELTLVVPFVASKTKTLLATRTAQALFMGLSQTTQVEGRAWLVAAPDLLWLQQLMQLVVLKPVPATSPLCTSLSTTNGFSFSSKSC
jgi:hypothetical protein